MAHRSLFHKASTSFLYSGTFHLNPMLPKGGRLLLSGATKSAALEPFRNPVFMSEHVSGSRVEGVVCLTPNMALAIEHAKNGGYGANDWEASSSHKPPYAVLIVDTTNLVYLDVNSVLSQSFYEQRINRETESIAPIVMPTEVANLLINDVRFKNPLYIPIVNTKTENLIAELEASYLGMLKAQIDLNQPKAAKAYENYLAILTELCGGLGEFKDRTEALKNSIAETGYALEPSARHMLDAAIKSVKNPFLR